jgi:ATP-dependent helicase/nuclease subunit B
VERISVTALERLGRCPLRFFFRHVLDVAEPDEEATAEALSPAELGGQVHDLLQRLYRQLDEEGLFRAGEREKLLARAEAWLDRERDRLFGDAGRRVALRLPVLWELTLGSWFEALSAFVRSDLMRIAAEGWQAGGFETAATGTLELGAGSRIEIYGRFDRRWILDDRILIGDYKTSGRLSDRAEPRSMLKGLELQVPLYRMLSGEDSTVELLGVGPFYASDDEEDRRVSFAGFAKEALDAGFSETLRTLVDLARRGRFPLRSERHCAWCAYRLACRRNHPPTLHREWLDVDGRRYARLQRKSTRGPLLKDVEQRDD